MQNPLFAERYYAELIDRMAMLQINADPVLEDTRIADRVNAAKLRATQEVANVRQSMEGHLSAGFLTIAELTQGRVLEKDGMLYFSTDFLTYPAPELEVFLTNAVDPRDAAFPDDTAFTLGTLQSPYGAQAYIIPEDQRTSPFRTVVLWDRTTGRILAFAQLG